MDLMIPNQVTLTDLRAILQYLPQSQDNQSVEAYLLDLIEKKRVDVKLYMYTVPITALAAGTNNSPYTLQIQNDADFVVVRQTFDANIANAAQTISNTTYPLVKVLMANAGTADPIMDQAAAVPSIFGTGPQPYDLPVPWYLAANSSVAISASNYDAASTYNLNLHFIGYKLKKNKG